MAGCRSSSRGRKTKRVACDLSPSRLGRERRRVVGADNVVAAYLDDGELYQANVVQQVPKGLLVQPRAMELLSGGVLWVLSGSAKVSNILSFTGSGADYVYNGGPVVQFSDVDSVWHPYEVTFVFDDSDPTMCFVSNQDTNTVIRLAVRPGFEQATAMPISSALPSHGSFLAATFVASADGQLPGVKPTTPVPPPQGLQAEADKKVEHSVRGVLWHGGALYVADEVARTVKVYDAAGNYVGQSNHVGSPDHLVARGDVIYLGSGGAPSGCDLFGASAVTVAASAFSWASRCL